MLFEHRPWSPWAIEVLTFEEDKLPPDALFDGFYRSTIREGKECEQFTLLSKTNDECLVQIRIFKNGDLTIESHPSTFTRVDRHKKRISVTCAPLEGEQALQYDDRLIKGR
ncbi:hypothetical protein [Paenibacillus sp. PDC88]|uniref:hypothetical protein n=1 Tax=Paenibacillus TaxID=44249 RepID=UPI00089669B6|nr:hypothetical protein [Paenibacillus sp. PDC88]SDX82696.1 hypothetical protein SAMN05518848_11819 [Paenibacillus sp. PDC88]